jgi:tetratricopeptide (TPR) repeat protein
MISIFKTFTEVSVHNPLNEVQNAKARAQERDNKRYVMADKLFEEAIFLIDQFKIDYDDENYLHDAAEKLDESLKLNHRKGESYFWLAYILYSFDQVREALRYLHEAKAIIPDYPQINQLQEIISG